MVAIGCADFMDDGCGGPTSQTTLSAPTGLTFDTSGNLWVADTGNNRVLKFPPSNLVTDGAASIVLGQPAFSSSYIVTPDVPISQSTLTVSA